MEKTKSEQVLEEILKKGRVREAKKIVDHIRDSKTSSKENYYDPKKIFSVSKEVPKKTETAKKMDEPVKKSVEFVKKPAEIEKPKVELFHKPEKSATDDDIKNLEEKHRSLFSDNKYMKKKNEPVIEEDENDEKQDEVLTESEQQSLSPDDKYQNSLVVEQKKSFLEKEEKEYEIEEELTKKDTENAGPIKVKVNYGGQEIFKPKEKPDSFIKKPSHRWFLSKEGEEYENPAQKKPEINEDYEMEPVKKDYKKILEFNHEQLKKEKNDLFLRENAAKKNESQKPDEKKFSLFHKKEFEKKNEDKIKEKHANDEKTSHDPKQMHDLGSVITSQKRESIMEQIKLHHTDFVYTGEDDTKKSAEIKTKIDDLYNMVLTNKILKIEYASKSLGVPEAEIERWAKILEEYKLIEIFYPAFGKIKLLAPVEKVKKWEKHSKNTK